MPSLSTSTLPLLGTSVLGLYLAHFLFQMFLGGKLRHKGNAVTVGVNALALLLSLAGWAQEADQPSRWGASWTGIDTLNFDLFWDATTGNMMVLVTLITLLVTIYSTAYMRGEEERQRYWAYLSLFTGSMAGLVLSGSLFTLFIFWELVGVSSWLLIGYWRTREKAAKGSFKAFVVNRAADVFFLIGLCLLFPQQVLPSYGMPYNLFADQAATQMNWGMLFLFLGAAGKSAQFPFQAWLPDAMAGPTPVSSLLHAATMVAAGVYLMVRLSPLLNAPEQSFIAFVGAATALIGAVSALGQTNIKRVLAFSTVSQLGLMMFALGAGTGESAHFHLYTHAYFKCGLFLSAGAVIHALHHWKEQQKAAGKEVLLDEEDLRHMGGLRKAMPRTFWVYVIFAASLAGLPLTSGFLSKEGILDEGLHFGSALQGWGWVATLAVWSTALLTPLYMMRHGILIFGGKSRLPQGESAIAPKETPWAMWVPMLVLAIASTAVLWEVPALQASKTDGGGLLHIHIFSHPQLPLMSLGLAAMGILLALVLYRKGWNERAEGSLLLRFSRKEFFWNAVYDHAIAKPALLLAQVFAWTDKHLVDGIVNGVARGMVSAKENTFSLSRFFWRFDTRVIDWLVNGLANLLWRTGGRLRRLQSGKLQAYLGLSLLGLLLLLGAFIYFAAR
jgi:NADH-quinone oxidoreductase subunit L